MKTKRCGRLGRRLSMTSLIIGVPFTGINGLGSLKPAPAKRLPRPAMGTTIVRGDEAEVGDWGIWGSRFIGDYRACERVAPGLGWPAGLGSKVARAASTASRFRSAQIQTPQKASPRLPPSS